MTASLRTLWGRLMEEMESRLADAGDTLGKEHAFKIV